MARTVPVRNADYTGDELYMQVSGWEGCERGTMSLESEKWTYRPTKLRCFDNQISLGLQCVDDSSDENMVDTRTI